MKQIILSVQFPTGITLVMNKLFFGANTKTCNIGYRDMFLFGWLYIVYLRQYAPLRRAGRGEARGRVPKTSGHVGMGVVTSGMPPSTTILLLHGCQHDTSLC